MRPSRKRELKKRLLLNRTVNQMKKSLTELEFRREQYIDAARQAQAQGLASQLKLASNGIKMTLQQQYRLQSMLLNFELISQMKDLSAVSQTFLSGTEVLSKEINRLTDPKAYGRVQKHLAKSMAKMELQDAAMTEFLESSEDMIGDSVQSNPQTVTDDEIQRLIQGRTAAERDEDEYIQKELDEIAKLIGQ